MGKEVYGKQVGQCQGLIKDGAMYACEPFTWASEDEKAFLRVTHFIGLGTCTNDYKYNKSTV